MNRREFIATAGAGAIGARDSLAAAELASGASRQAASESRQTHSVPASPFNAGNRAQLFVNQLLVRRTQNISFTLHPAEKHPENPLISRDKPWENWDLEIYGSVLFDAGEKIFKMWYRGGKSSPCFPNPDYSTTLYAISHDGITWEKPLVGTIPCSGEHMRTNVVAYACAITSVIKDPEDPDPERRYKMICMQEERQAYETKISPDGLHWKPLSKKPICAGRDVITGYYDMQRRLYVAFPKIMTQWRGFVRRIFYVITSPDFERWTQPQLAWKTDLQDDAGSLWRLDEVRSLLSEPDNPELIRTDFYGIGVYQHESCTLAFPWIFTINNNAPDKGPNDGPIELQLGISRDLVHWERPFRLPCVLRGKPGEWDCGIMVTSSRALRVGDEIWLYYSGENHTHGAPCVYQKNSLGHAECKGGIGLAKWKLDRFASADGPVEGGTLTTIPIVFSGTRLEINASVKPGGEISVEILHPAGQHIEGFGSSDAFTGDELRYTIRWKGDERKVSRLQGEPVCLRFYIKQAELYSFAFRQ